MMKNLYIIPLIATGLLAVGCSKENPFNGNENSEEGQVLKSALAVSKAGDSVVITRAQSADDADIDNFKVNFMTTNSSVAYRSFTYGEMPDVVTLAAGEYYVLATYGEDREAEWENPYYSGKSSNFEVTPYEITSYIDPIECSLQNIKVNIEFDASLKAAMSSDSYVEVKVGDGKGLNYTTTEADAAKAGYFRQDGETTLVATFNGKVNGVQISETKSYNNVQKGCWYKLTFKLHEHVGDDAGQATGSVSVDATVFSQNVNTNVVITEDQPLDDSERPKEGSDPTPTPDPGTTGQAPDIIFDTAGLSFNTPIVCTTSTACDFTIYSYADTGIQEFTCEIISDKLDKDVMVNLAGLDTTLDLVNTPESQVETLTNLGFPSNVGGKKEVPFSLTGFMPMMAALGTCTHEFKLHVKDANGEVTKSVILQFN